MKKGRRADGSRVRRPDSAALARPKTKFLLHGNGASRALLRDSLDGRSTFARVYRQREAMLTSDLGGDLSYAQRRLVAHAVRHSLAVDTAWHGLLQTGLLTSEGDLTGAMQAHERASAAERATLEKLGLHRIARDTSSLADLFRAAAIREEAKREEQRLTIEPPEADTDA